jgi:predicted patatin/cPLA2 family phospholipase
MPLLAGAAIDLAGQAYYDGGIIDSLPYSQAERSGASHLLVLRSWPAAPRRRQPNLTEYLVARAAFKRCSPALWPWY